LIKEENVFFNGSIILYKYNKYIDLKYKLSYYELITYNNSMITINYIN